MEPVSVSSRLNESLGSSAKAIGLRMLPVNEEVRNGEARCRNPSHGGRRLRLAAFARKESANGEDTYSPTSSSTHSIQGRPELVGIGMAFSSSMAARYALTLAFPSAIRLGISSGTVQDPGSSAPRYGLALQSHHQSLSAFSLLSL